MHFSNVDNSPNLSQVRKLQGPISFDVGSQWSMRVKEESLDRYSWFDRSPVVIDNLPRLFWNLSHFMDGLMGVETKMTRDPGESSCQDHDIFSSHFDSSPDEFWKQDSQVCFGSQTTRPEGGIRVKGKREVGDNGKRCWNWLLMWFRSPVEDDWSV